MQTHKVRKLRMKIRFVGSVCKTMHVQAHWWISHHEDRSSCKGSSGNPSCREPNAALAFTTLVTHLTYLVIMPELELITASPSSPTQKPPKCTRPNPSPCAIAEPVLADLGRNTGFARESRATIGVCAPTWLFDKKSDSGTMLMQSHAADGGLEGQNCQWEAPQCPRLCFPHCRISIICNRRQAMKLAPCSRTGAKIGRVQPNSVTRASAEAVAFWGTCPPNSKPPPSLRAAGAGLRFLFHCFGCLCLASAQRVAWYRDGSRTSRSLGCIALRSLASPLLREAKASPPACTHT